MSSVDYFDYVDVPCQCGAGRIRATCASPNYSFGRCGFFGKIECPVCAEAYQLQVLSFTCVRLISRTQLAASHAAFLERSCQANALLETSPEIQELRNWLLAGLAKERFMVGKHRWLSAKGLMHDTLSRFRREFTGDQPAVERIIRSNIWHFKEPPWLAEMTRQYKAIMEAPGPEVAYIDLAEKAGDRKPLSQ
jgi:hypothetical protein